MEFSRFSDQEDNLTSPMAPRISLLLMTSAFIAYTTAVEKGHYRAAVVDYHVLSDNSLSPRQNLMANVHNYEQYIKRANEETVDIIVFPEGGLLGRDNSVFLNIPDPALKVIPLGDSTYDESIQTLSSYAKNYSLYLAVNLHENFTDSTTKRSFKYNTNVVFSREGAVVARYRKFNLYGEGVDVTDNPEHSFFDSDFGVRFGQFICFDILFKEPTLALIYKHNVTDFIYPSHWFSELPFLTSVQRQWSWAVGNDVNLLSAGNNYVPTGSGGSGIFRGKNSKNLYTLSTMTGSTLIIGDVPIRGKTGVQYKIVAYDGDIRFGIDPKVNMLQTCGVVLCLNHSVSSCGSAGVNGFLPSLSTPAPNVTFTSINISGNFMKEDVNILPNVLLWPSNVANSATSEGFLIEPNESATVVPPRIGQICGPMAPRISLLLMTSAFIAYTTAVEKGHYRAAVVEYHVLRDNSLSPRQNLMANVHNYEQYIRRANEESVDIIVFPEAGLLKKDSSTFLNIPDPAQKVIPLGDPTYDESIQTLSSYAKNYSIYLVVNLHENFTDSTTKRFFKYNTNVVFSREGAVIARYRKFNLYGEGVDVTDSPEHSFFDSDFGVRFGQFTCFDIMSKEPALALIYKYNITDFVYPAHWFSELPFLTSVQRQWSWAVGNDVNLLAACNNYVPSGTGGSGIFRGKNSKNLYTLSPMTGSTLIIGDVPIRGKTGGIGKPDIKEGSYTKEEKFPLLQQNEMSKFAHDDVPLPADRTAVVFKKDLCHNHLCCTFDLSIQYVNPTAVQYKIVAYDGDIRFGIDPKVNMLQTCGVVLCLNHSVSSCGSAGVNGFLPSLSTPAPNVTFTSINISGNFMKEDVNILPNVLLWPSNVANSATSEGFLIEPNEVEFNKTNGNPVLISRPNRQIITVGIHSRIFSRDQDNSANAINVPMLAIIFSLLVPATLALFMYR
ncbi:hypothetical protein GE061_002801 [Apolygus lucorum]|uniref:CN hydrolase domain-containing protein n=1 Tax=Apolygus lucorum TaxID=248454 RepID=A0A8S9X5U0_APOLU|nr:hypothetical protein GE061_002801 [Apolygus lucorum]